MLHILYAEFAYMGRATAGEGVRYFRSKKRLTIALLAEMTAISRDALICYENGQTEPTPGRLLAIAAALDVKPDKLCDSYFLFLLYPYEQKLKEWRKEHRMTQQEFARHCGYPFVAVKRWERGVHRVTREQLSALLAK